MDGAKLSRSVLAPLTEFDGSLMVSVLLMSASPASDAVLRTPCASTGMVSCMASDSSSVSALTVTHASCGLCTVACHSTRASPPAGTVMYLSPPSLRSMPLALSWHFTFLASDR